MHQTISLSDSHKKKSKKRQRSRSPSERDKKKTKKSDKKAHERKSTKYMTEEALQAHMKEKSKPKEKCKSKEKDASKKSKPPGGLIASNGEVEIDEEVLTQCKPLLKHLAPKLRDLHELAVVTTGGLAGNKPLAQELITSIGEELIRVVTNEVKEPGDTRQYLLAHLWEHAGKFTHPKHSAGKLQTFFKVFTASKSATAISAGADDSTTRKPPSAMAMQP